MLLGLVRDDPSLPQAPPPQAKRRKASENQPHFHPADATPPHAHKPFTQHSSIGLLPISWTDEDQLFTSEEYFYACR
ncbi:hypothetical protein JOE56_001246 [Brevibacterium paucivorans]|uniref:Uncharacterized protein n=1 Tax=Brevibacterium paucivorans TaxID=170994 RepID=A0ABS2SJW5_9MICO|nr:hypothetical protein [Brevibacterium paucivorans]